MLTLVNAALALPTAMPVLGADPATWTPKANATVLGADSATWAPKPKRKTRFPAPTKAIKPTAANGLCDYIADYLPSFCSCEDKDLGAIAQCDVDVLGLDTIGVKADFEPCAQPLHIDLEITESDMGIDYPITGITAGEDNEIPIPGLSWGIPIVGTADAEMAVKIDGNLDDVTISLGVDACATVLGVEECGSDLTSELPIYLLNSEFDFSDICDSMKKKITLKKAALEK